MVLPVIEVLGSFGRWIWLETSARYGWKSLRLTWMIAEQSGKRPAFVAGGNRQTEMFAQSSVSQ
jgi:hypothetical protein